MRDGTPRSLVAPALALLLTSCVLSGDESYSTQAAGARAGISLVSSNAALAQTSTTSWSLAKTGSVTPATSTVTWQVTATPGATVAGQLVLTGALTVKNSGGGGAPIGNIVVNLQTKTGSSWITRSSVIADATQDDAATVARIHAQASSENHSSFTENAASGHLLFTDASTNSAFALVPQVTIAPGATVNLLFKASFNNNILALPVGKPVRAEIIVSFGNAGPAGASTSPNIDINGNGIIDADEDWVRSVPSRIGLTVPPQQPSTTSVALSDTVADITTTGTVTFSNPIINLGPTSGTVRVTYNAGTTGGTITNCAHLTGSGSSSLSLTACNTQSIGGVGCSPGAPGCGWRTNDVVAYSQDDRGGTGAPATLPATR